MDTASLFYSSYCLAHAMQNGFYVPKQLTEEAKELYLKFVTDTILKKYASQMSHLAPAGFWKNEKYTTLDLSAELNGLLDKKVPLFALYGKDDGLYSPDQVEELRRIIGTDHLKYFDNCSHNVFIDQQSKFIEAVEAWTK
jgi:proline iminopeptidase